MGGEVHADPPAWIFPVQACNSNYIILKQIQIIDTLVAKFRKADDATPQHDTFKTPGQASPTPATLETLGSTSAVVTKRQKHFQKFSSQTGSRPNASNQLAGVTSLYQTSRLVTRLVKNEMFHSNSYTKSSCNTEQHGNLMFHLQNSSSHRYVLP